MKEKEIEMLKENHVLNKLIIFLIVISLQTVYSQELSGSYFIHHKNGDIGSSNFTFKKNNEFRYFQEGFGHMPVKEEGTGHYKIINGKILFSFDLSKVTRRSEIEIVKNENRNDSVTVFFTILDKDKKNIPFIGGNIEYMFDGFKAAQTDTNGQVSLKFKKSDDIITFRHQSIAFPYIKTTVQLNRDYNITIKRTVDEIQQIEDEIWYFKINEQNGLLTLQSLDKKQNIWKNKSKWVKKERNKNGKRI